MNRRVLATLLVSFVILGALAPSLAAAAATPGQTTDAGAAAVSAPTAGSYALQEDETTNMTTTSTTSRQNNTTVGSTGRPTSSDVVRILPVQLDSKIVSVETDKQGARYNTSGPFAFFSISEPVEEAAIQQQGATATVLSGGNTVKIQYEDDAAPVGETSLYQLQVWFADGSSTTIELMASETSVTVSEGNLRKYRPELLDMLADAEAAGYERSPDGLEAYYTDTKETAELLDSLLAEQAKRLFGTLIGLLRNPLGAALSIAIVILVSLWILRKNKSILETISNDSGRAQRLRQQLALKLREDQQSAADHNLRDVDGISQLGEVYWQDAYDITTVAELAELFRGNYPVKRDGEIVRIGGVSELTADNVDQSWLEPVCRTNRLAGPEIALSHGKRALEEACRRYHMDRHYRDSLEATRELLDDLDESNDYNARFSSSTGGFGANSPAGGDD